MRITKSAANKKVAKSATRPIAEKAAKEQPLDRQLKQQEPRRLLTRKPLGQLNSERAIFIVKLLDKSV
jgi:hypothetical protein